MSKKENHWYLLGATVQLLGETMRPRAWQVGLWLLLVAGLSLGLQTGALEAILEKASSPAFVPVFTVVFLVVVLGGALIVRRWRQAGVRSGSLQALLDPGPERVIEVVARSLKGARMLPDADAFSAQARAVALALYGRGEEARRALAEVSWGSKAPLIQAIGLSAEGIVELLCRRDVDGALEKCRKARVLASVNPVLPGAAQTDRYHATCVAVAEALSGAGVGADLHWLEEGAADGRFPQLQLLASFGLAAAMDRSGHGGRAAELRAYILCVAPHCSPLHLRPDEFLATEPGPEVSSPAPVSSSLWSAEQVGGAAAWKRTTRRKVLKVSGIVVGLWLAMVVMFVAMWAFFNEAK